MSKTILFILCMAMMRFACGDMLPPPACFMIETAFLTTGCAGGTRTSDTCQYMASLLRLQYENGEGVCDKFPCVGYGQVGRSCTRIFPRSCSARRRNRNGICPIGKECCNFR